MTSDMISEMRTGKRKRERMREKKERETPPHTTKPLPGMKEPDILISENFFGIAYLR